MFRAFEVGEFLEWPAWRRLERVLRSNGGSYGLSGARGAGKSWLMLRAVEWVRGAPDAGRLGGIGLWYPSPSEYDPLAFLASLSDSFGTEIDRWYRRDSRVRRRRAIERAITRTTVVAAGLLVIVVLPRQQLDFAFLAAVVLLAFAGLGLAIVRGGPGAFPRERRLAAEAKVVRERARYSATRRESLEFGAEAGRGLLARARTARERELVEKRPATLSSLVNDFRALAAEAGEVTGRVVIAIDELDKMDEADKVRALLRDIKGIFEVPHVHFLVSVSDEAARRLSLGALAGRNEFNSSFYTVIEAPPATPEQLADLLERRTGSVLAREVAIAMAVLAGAILARHSGSLTSRRGANVAGEAITTALEDEALTLRREIVTSEEADGLPVLGSEPRVQAFSALPDASFADSPALAALAATALAAPMWDPPWQDDAFKARFGEPWRRLMVRLAVASQLAEARSLVRVPELGLRLRDVVLAASQSAEVARIVLEQQLVVDTRRPAVHATSPAIASPSWAGHYEEVRAWDPGTGGNRTQKLDAVVVDMRAVARDAQYDPTDIAGLLSSTAAGERLAALAAIEATGDPNAFEAVLAATVKPQIR